MEVTTGSLDEEVLLGEWGRVLAEAVDGHCWGLNAVRGVTDQVRVGRLFEKSDSKVVVGGG